MSGMEFQLIQGQFDPKEGLSLLREIVAVKIKFHEQKIATAITEEDIKFRENRIKDLQKEWQQITHQLQSSSVPVAIHASLVIDASYKENHE